jgi:long-chain acyl-CoA synthetase
VVGQDRNFCTMLISLDPDAVAGWVAGGPLEGRPYGEVVAAPQARALIGGYVEQLNAKLNRWETIRNFAVLPRDLSIEEGDLTPSLKIKRRSTEANFAAEIAEMYVGSLAPM